MKYINADTVQYRDDLAQQGWKVHSQIWIHPKKSWATMRGISRETTPSGHVQYLMYLDEKEVMQGVTDECKH